MIPTRLHGIIDYLVALILIAAPFVLGFADGGPAQYATIGLGLFVVVYSLLTNYELGAVPLLSFPAHLVLDVVFALALIASPWAFGFSSLIWWPHVLFGVAALVVVALSARSPARLA